MVVISERDTVSGGSREPDETPVGGRVARNASALLVAQGASYVVAFAFGIYVARALGVSAFGRYTFLMTLYGLAGILVHLGLQTLGVREVARARGRVRELFAAFWALKSGAALLGAVAIALYLALGGASGDARIPAIAIAVALLLDAHNESVAIAFHGTERFRTAAILGVAGSLAFASLGSGALLAGHGIAGLFVALVLAKGLQAALGRGALARVAGGLPPAREDPAGGRGRELRRLLVAAWPFFVSKLFFLVYFRIDIVMLEFLRGEEEVGLYGVAYKFVNIGMAFGGALTSALFPVMALAGARSRERLDALVSDGVRAMAVVGVLAAAALHAAPRSFLTLLYGDAYGGAADALALLAWGLALLLVELVLTNALLSLDRERFAAWMGAIAVVLNVGLNLWLIPRLGAAGAAWATLACEFVLVLGYGSVVLRGPLGREVGGLALRLLPALALALAVPTLFRSLAAWPTVFAALGTVAAALFATGAVRAADLRRLGALVPGGARP